MKLIEQTNEHAPTLSVKEASRIMGVSEEFLRLSLIQGNFPFGTATKMTGNWRYYINRKRFVSYMNAEDLSQPIGGDQKDEN